MPAFPAGAVEVALGDRGGPEGFLFVRPDGRIVLADSSVERAFGYDPGELVGRSLESLVPEGLREAHRRHSAAFAKTPRPRPMGIGREVRGRRKDGSEFAAGVGLRALDTPEGPLFLATVRPVGDAGAEEDLLERGDLAASLLRAQSDLGEGVALADIWSERFLLVNESFCATTGYTTEELLAMPSFMDIVPEDERPAIMSRVAQRREGQRIPETLETAVLAKGERRVEIALGVHQPNARQVITIIRDITDRKRVEAALRGALDREHAVSERLQAVDRLKNLFLRALSHDLRNPVAAVRGFAEVARDRWDLLPPEERSRVLDRIVTQTGNMTRMLDNLLDLDRLGLGVVEPARRQTDVAALVRRVLKDADTGDRPPQVDLHPMRASVDPVWVERILDNLLSNIARHTPAGAPVWVRGRRENGGILLAVEDAGPGIPDRLKEAIFQPFTRGERPGGAGTGVGLSLVAAFARLHGGRAWVEDRAGGGASFRVFLPDPPGVSNPTRREGAAGTKGGTPGHRSARS